MNEGKKMKTVKEIRVDVNKCNGCLSCELSCSAAHAMPPYSSVNPARSRISVVMDETRDVYIPIRAGDYAEADAAFAAAWRRATYDRGLSLAATGSYALAVAYFDGVLFVDPSDTDARFNRDLVARLVPEPAPRTGQATSSVRSPIFLRPTSFDRTKL